jgi:hypothetical protein
VLVLDMEELLTDMQADTPNSLFIRG